MRPLLLALALAAPAAPAAPAAAAAARASPAPLPAAGPFAYTPVQRAQFFRELEGQLETLSGLPPSRIVPHLDAAMTRDALPAPRLAARQALLEALGKPTLGLPAVAEALRRDPVAQRGERAASALEGAALKLKRREAAAPGTLRAVARLRARLEPFAGGLRETTAVARRSLDAVFDGGAEGGGAVRVADRRYGMASQVDRRFRRIGYFTEENPDETAVCGPTCLVNALARFRREAGRRQRDPVREIERLVESVGPGLAIPAEDLLEHGLTAPELRRLARAHLRDLGYRPRLRTWGLYVDEDARGRKLGAVRRDIPASALLGAAEPGTAVIVAYDEYRRGKPLDRIRPLTARDKGFLYGHYMLLVGYEVPDDPGGPIRVLFNDPEEGEVSATLVPVRPRNFRVRTYRLVFDSGRRKRLVNVMTAAIRIRL